MNRRLALKVSHQLNEAVSLSDQKSISLKSTQNELQTVQELVELYRQRRQILLFKRQLVTLAIDHDYVGAESYYSKRINLESAVYAKKAKISKELLYFHRTNSHLNIIYKTGDFITVEFFRVTTPIRPGIYDVQFVGFICTIDDEYKAVEMEEIGSFWTKANDEPRRTVVRDIFFQRPKNSQKETDIFLVVRGIGQNDNGSIVPGSLVTGIRRIGRWVQDCKGILSADIDFSSRAVYLKEESENRMSGAKKWIPDYKTVAGLKNHFAKSSRRNDCEFLNMELSNEQGIGILDEFGEDKGTEKKSLCSIKPSSSATEIKEYVILLSENMDASKEESPASLSSGYGSMPSSTASVTSSGNVFDELPSDFQNSCLICRKRFPSVEKLLLHLDLSYPSLTFTVDPIISHRINIVLAESSVQNRREFIFLSRSLLRSRRKQILSNYFPNDVPKSQIRRSNAKTVTLDETFPVFFNMPRYQKVPFPGMHGVETPRFWVNEFQKRNIYAFSDVNDEEKEMMVMWNEYINHRQNRVITETTGSHLLKSFVEEKGAEIMDKAGIRQFLAHSASQYRKGLLHTDAIALCLRILAARNSPEKKPQKRSKPGDGPNAKKTRR